MTMDVKLSIGITAYNQIGAIKKNLLNILQSPRDDFEIVLQDDCSQDDIASLIDEIHDPRVRYCRNSCNLGHDRNIIELFRNCRAGFVFLLRSTDTLIEDGIDKIISFIEKNPETGYCRFSCTDERGIIRIRYEDRICNAGPQSVELHKRVLIHPSGELFNLKYFDEKDWDCYIQYLEKYFDNNKKFIVHVLMRYKLILCAGISTSSEITWSYSRTNKRKDVAQNRSSNGISVYHPLLRYQRYNCKMSYVVHELSGEGKEELIKAIIDESAWLIIFIFKYINRDKEMQRHYCYTKIPFSPLKEMSRFKEKTAAFAEQYEEPYREIVKQQCSRITIMTLAHWQIERTMTNIRGILGAMKRRIVGNR